VAPVSGPIDRDQAHPEVAADVPYTNLPSRLLRMVGRADDALMVSARLAATRFVTILGAGGVGKTTVAVAVAHDLVEAFAGIVLFVDLGMLSDPSLVPTAVASMLGLTVQSEDATPGLIAYLRDKRLLLILDSCEHLIEAVAPLASRIFVAAPQVHILATSREALRVEGEHVYRLDPLACPPDDPALTAVVAQSFPATQLFLERAAAGGARLELGDADAPIVASICRKLDGVALAIELAARRVEAYGLEQTAALLDKRLTLQWPGQRTAPPRHKTLQATLDWSFELLSGLERRVLRRLAVFVGHFTLDAALAVATSATVDQALVFGAIDNLVAKSMVATRPAGAMMRYRLLDTTRAYTLEIGIDEAEAADLAMRHASYYRRWLEQTGTEWPSLSNGVDRSPYFAGLNNVRAALEWCFGVNGNAEMGIGLAAAAAPVFSTMSLLTECHRWSERAILALDDGTRGGSEEMHLRAALGMSLMFSHGESDAARAALSRSLAIAEARGDVVNQVRLLGLLHIFHMRRADFKTALHHARRSAGVAGTIVDPAAVASAHYQLGASLYLAGDLNGARVELEAALQHGPSTPQTRSLFLGFDHHHWANITLARTLWFQGHPAEAVERIGLAVTDAERMGHPVSLAIALQWAASMFLSTGDLGSAEEHIDWFIAHAESHSLGPYVAVGRGLKGQLAIRQGEARAGIESLRDCLEKMRAARYQVLSTEFNISLVQGLAATGRFAEAFALLDEAIGLVEANGDVTYMPELLRVKGGLLLSMPQPRGDEAEKCFMGSLELSRRYGARAWELRAAIDLAALWSAQGRSERARALLQPVFQQFAVGSDTADLKAAERLLTTLA
jgi:predicted ATPase